MTANKRIFLNVIATYGRSLFSMACGLFTARWVLEMLGQVDFGLYGVVGGLSAFVTFFNSLLSMSIGRFYAFAVGEANKPGNEERGLEECRRWFSTAVFIHTVVPIVLVAVGYPVGEWAVRNFLTVPPDRITACVWVWRCVCLMVFVSMVNVPYQAMYTAKQNIAELTIYSFVTTTLNVCVVYYMFTHPADHLVHYAAWIMLMNVVPQIIIGVRAFIVYPECRLRRKYLISWPYLKPILSFSGFRFLNALSGMGANQGLTIVVNKYLGPRANAAMAVGTQLSAQAQTLATSFAGAFMPAITNAAGEGDLEKMRSLALRTCKLGACALLVFAIPLALESHEVLRLWLKTPPPMAAELCVCVLVAYVLEKIAEGHYMAIFAVGKIAEYQIVISSCGFSVIAIGWMFVALGWGVIGIGLAMIVGKIFGTLLRLYYGRKIAGLSIKKWTIGVFVPICIASGLTIFTAFMVQMFSTPSFIRVVSTTLVAEIVFLPLVWILVLDDDEKKFVCEKAKRIFLKWN